ncbi:PREDICTED: uncharacterized protein LOC104376617 [Tauraco erythrolophus]|uniref:uncharacterized protein LOC104376617 n=1 Tax=Tauraco erythrolophus TaxID=121530 RepID=UPI0005236BE7|nr:PREDICTED: uncharacterized protein LOC104376617 [Tauraco erythrolophus]
MRIRVPFNMGDLDAWRKVVKDYREDPLGIAKRFELIVKNQDPDWKDIDIMLDAMTETEKELIVRTARTHVQAQIIAGTLAGGVDQHVPLTDPHWDPNDKTDYRTLKRYQNWIKFGLENAIPKAVNWSALYAVKQGQTETPTEFLGRLQQAMRKYTTLDPSSDVGQQQLVSLFLDQSSEAIRRNLQRLKEPEVRDLEKLIEEAWRVYRNRESNARRKLGRTIATATIVALEQRSAGAQGPPGGRGRGRGGPPRGSQGGFQTTLQSDQCAYCGKRGHWRKECPKLKPEVVAEAKWIKQYPLRLEDRRGIKETAEKFQEFGLLVECESEYNTPILPVKKPDGKYRIVQDLRAVNRIVEDLYPLVANLYTLLTSLKETYEWFTVLDLKDAFFCLTLAPESRNLFALEWENPNSGRKTQLTWTVLPQGFKNSPTIFGDQLARELELWERPPGNGILLQYVDDILIATEKREECKEWTVSLLNFLGLSGYRVSLQKAQILQKEVVYLGYLISKGQRQLGNERKEAICKTPEPTTAALMEQDDVEIATSTISNPASFLSDKQETDPIVHECKETTETVYASGPDLKEEQKRPIIHGIRMGAAL